MINPTIYQKNGFKNRDAYLDNLADDLGISREVVDAAADMLGESEDFDGLVSSLEDFAGGY